MKILLVDDSSDVGFLVAKSLAPYSVDQAVSLAQAETLLATSAYRLILIDVSLPDGDGFAFCDRLNKNEKYDQIPKIFLTAHSEIAEKVFGLNIGADDYITKPFDSTELKARVDSRLRHQSANSMLYLNGFELDPDFQHCRYRNGDSSLDFDFTPTEFRILLALLKAEGRPLTRGEMVRTVWKSHGLNIEERGVDTHIAHLRKKMQHLGSLVVSVYGKGYALVHSSNKNVLKKIA